jgi:sec-independent protein translocase protein TatC
MGIVSPEMLARFRRHAIVVLAILSAFLTPADPYTMLMMLVPMMLLYEASIVVTRAIAGRRSRSTELTTTEGSST